MQPVPHRLPGAARRFSSQSHGVRPFRRGTGHRMFPQFLLRFRQHEKKTRNEVWSFSTPFIGCAVRISIPNIPNSAGNKMA